VFEAPLEDREILALVKGRLSEDKPVLCRMHTGSIIGDLFSSSPFDGGTIWREAIDANREGGLRRHRLPASKSRLKNQIEAHARDPAKPPPSSPVSEVPQRAALREFGLGAQILRELAFTGCVS